MDNQEQQDYIKAGQIASQAVEYAKSIIKPNTPLIEIAEKVEDKIKQLGGNPAFPINLSINEIAAHYTPSKDDETLATGLLKIDLGVEYQGAIADTAFSIDLTPNQEHKEIIQLNEQALNNALQIIKPNIELNQIGKAIADTIKNTNYTVIKNLSGHSLDIDTIHAGITISNHENTNTTELNNIAIAIEPFLTTGKGEIYEGKSSEIYLLQQEKPIRDKDARRLLEFIKTNYKTKPFCKRWLEKQNIPKLNFCLSQLTQQEILHNYQVLVEKFKAPVSQAEHTILITNDKITITTK